MRKTADDTKDRKVVSSYSTKQHFGFLLLPNTAKEKKGLSGKKTRNSPAQELAKE